MSKDQALQDVVTKYVHVTGMSYPVMLKDVIRTLVHPDVLPLLKTYIEVVETDELDWARGNELHREYGHEDFVLTATALGKSFVFRTNVCLQQRCSMREVNVLTT